MQEGCAIRAGATEHSSEQVEGPLAGEVCVGPECAEVLPVYDLLIVGGCMCDYLLQVVDAKAPEWDEDLVMKILWCYSEC